MQPEPSRPQSGESMQAMSAGHAASGESVGSSSMPPTLFRLPKLKKADAVSPSSEPHDDRSEPPQSRPPVPPAVSTSVDTPANDAQKPSQRDSTTVTPQPRDFGTYGGDAPAGRSWMDSVRSHGVVVVLLLIFVVAAVATNRTSEPGPNDAAVVDRGEFALDVDQGLVATSPQLEPTQTSATEFGAPETTLSTPTVNPSEVVELMRTATNLDAQGFSPVATQSSVELQSGFEPASGYSEASSTRHYGSTVNAQMVSTRLRQAMEERRNQMPTLDELAESLPLEEPEGLESRDGYSSGANTQQTLTKTPMWTNDLGQYLPELPVQGQ